MLYGHDGASSSSQGISCKWTLLFYTDLFESDRHRLAAVNFFLGCVGVTQVTRIVLYQRSLKNASVGEVVKDDAKDIAETVKVAAKDADSKLKSIMK